MAVAAVVSARAMLPGAAANIALSVKARNLEILRIGESSFA